MLKKILLSLLALSSHLYANPETSCLLSQLKNANFLFVSGSKLFNDTKSELEKVGNESNFLNELKSINGDGVIRLLTSMIDGELYHLDTLLVLEKKIYLNNKIKLIEYAIAQKTMNEKLQIFLAPFIDKLSQTKSKTDFIKHAIENVEMNENIEKLFAPLAEKIEGYEIQNIVQHAIKNNKMNENMRNFLATLAEKIEGYEIKDIIQYAIEKGEMNENMRNFLAPLAKKIASSSYEIQNIVQHAIKNVEMNENMRIFLATLAEKITSNYEIENIIKYAIENVEMNENMQNFLALLAKKIESYEIKNIVQHAIEKVEMNKNMRNFLAPLAEKIEGYEIQNIVQHAIEKGEMNEDMRIFLAPLAEKINGLAIEEIIKYAIKNVKMNENMEKLFAPLAKKIEYNKENLIKSFLNLITEYSYYNNSGKIKIITELLNADWNNELSISSSTIRDILLLNDNKLRIATLNNVNVLDVLTDNEDLRTQVFEEAEKKEILSILEDAVSKTIERYKVAMKDGTINLTNRQSLLELSESVNDFSSVTTVVKPLYLKTYLKFQNNEAVNQEIKKQILSLRKDLDILCKTMTEDQKISLNVEEVRQGLDYVENCITASKIDPVHFITMLNALRDSPSEHLRLTLHNIKGVFAHHYTEKNNLDPRKVSFEQKLYNQANASFDLDSYSVNSPNQRTSNLKFQNFVDEVLNQNVKLKDGYIGRSMVVAAAQKFYKTNEALYKERSLWDNAEDLEHVNSSGRMLIDFLRESVTAGGTGRERCAMGVSVTMAITTLRAVDPEFDTYSNIDYTKNLRCNEAIYNQRGI